MPGSRWDDDTEFEVDIDDDSAPEARLVEVESTPAPAAGEPDWLEDYVECPAGSGGSRRTWGGKFWVPR